MVVILMSKDYVSVGRCIVMVNNLQYGVVYPGTLAEAVNGNDTDGMYFDMVCQLLEAVFRMQEFEETETSEDDGKQLLGKTQLVSEDIYIWRHSHSHSSASR